MARVPPLAVAAVAGILLVVVLGVDASMNRTYRLEVQAVDGWKTVAEGPVGGEHYGRAIYSLAPVTVADNTSVTFRVTVDNGYAWGFSEPYEVLSQGRVVAAGVVEAPARGAGAEQFTLNAAQVREPGGYGPERATGGELLFLELRIDGEYLYGETVIQEASA